MFDVLREWALQDKRRVISLEREREYIKAHMSGSEYRDELEINWLELESARSAYRRSLKDLTDYYEEVMEMLKIK